MELPKKDRGAVPPVRHIVHFLELIKFSHTIFALPFALISVVLVLNCDDCELPQKPVWLSVFWIAVSMAGARSGAMGFNRLIDRRWDAANPRTADRHSVTGVIRPPAIVAMIAASFSILIFAAWQLNPLAFRLSPVAIFLVCFYSYTKRFTNFAHLFLGFAVGAAPVASWIAMTGSISRSAIVLGASVFAWVAGFDILYALQDCEFDRKARLKSIPARFGISTSLAIAKALHAATLFLWIVLAQIESLGAFFYLGVAACALLLIREHNLLKKDDLSKLGIAFFNTNSYIGVTLFVSVLLDRAIF